MWITPIYPNCGLNAARGLVVTMPGSQASVRRLEFPLDPHERVGLVAI